MKSLISNLKALKLSAIAVTAGLSTVGLAACGSDDISADPTSKFTVSPTDSTEASATSETSSVSLAPSESESSESPSPEEGSSSSSTISGEEWVTIFAEDSEMALLAARKKSSDLPDEIVWNWGLGGPPGAGYDPQAELAVIGVHNDKVSKSNQVAFFHNREFQGFAGDFKYQIDNVRKTDKGVFVLFNDPQKDGTNSESNGKEVFFYWDGTKVAHKGDFPKI